MTIAIAASGARAGAAVRDALLGAELLGRGAIGGFAVLAILDEDGRLQHRVTQRDGVCGLEVPEAWMAARIAAVISSGPDRPEPLIQFLPGSVGVGLVTGHRLPNRAGLDGRALNAAVLAMLDKGVEPKAAVESVLAANPEADAGLIAINAQGALGWGNTARVGRRTDLGQFTHDDGSSRVAILHNAIFSSEPLAPQVGALAWARLKGLPGSIDWIRMAAAVPFRFADRDRLHVDAAGRITAIDNADPYRPEAPRRTTVVHLGGEIWRQGVCAGHVITELVADVVDGIAMPCEGATSNTLLMRLNHVAS